MIGTLIAIGAFVAACAAMEEQDKKDPRELNRTCSCPSCCMSRGGYQEKYGHFHFLYQMDECSPGRIKVSILTQPAYGIRDTSPSVIHRWPARNSAPPSICFKETHKPATFAQAQHLAHDWARRTEIYVRTGVPISSQIASG